MHFTRWINKREEWFKFFATALGLPFCSLSIPVGLTWNRERQRESPQEDISSCLIERQLSSLDYKLWQHSLWIIWILNDKTLNSLVWTCMYSTADHRKFFRCAPAFRKPLSPDSFSTWCRSWRRHCTPTHSSKHPIKWNQSNASTNQMQYRHPDPIESAQTLKIQGHAN